jgi:multicomponent K+:H+ antiporter subunit G
LIERALVAGSALDWAIAALLIGGSAFAFVGSLGLARFADFYKRLHGPTKATTLGVGCALIASCIFFTRIQGVFSAREILIALLLFATAPVSAQILVKSAFSEDPDGAPPAAPRDASRKADENRGKNAAA